MEENRNKPEPEEAPGREQKKSGGGGSRKRGTHPRRCLPIRPAVLGGLAAGTAAMIMLVIWWVPDAGILPDPLQAQVDILPDSHARDGTLHETEGRAVEEGDFWVVINQIPKAVSGTRSCNLEYENPDSNHYSARVNLYLADTGELLGGTRRVDPGSYVKDISLKKKLKPGDYPVTAQIELFKDKTPAGGMTLDLILRVLEQEGDSAG